MRLNIAVLYRRVVWWIRVDVAEETTWLPLHCRRYVILSWIWSGLVRPESDGTSQSSARVCLQDWRDLPVAAARRSCCFLAQVINFLEWRSLYKRDRNRLQVLPNTSRLWSETPKHDYSATKTRTWRRFRNSCRTWRWVFAFVFSEADCWFLCLESCCSLIQIHIPKVREIRGWRISPS